MINIRTLSKIWSYMNGSVYGGKLELESSVEREKGTGAAYKNVIYLLSCALNGIIPSSKQVAMMDLSELYSVSERQMLTASVGFALESAGVQNDAFKRARVMAIRKTAIMDAEMAKILRQFEKAGIWYMPMKGVVLKDFYPAYGMRQMADTDILIDTERTDDIRDIMKQLGFDVEHYDKSYHDCYSKPPVSNFELHHTLVSPLTGKTIYSYYHNVKNRLLKDEDNTCGWHFSPEDFYIFMIVHEYKHYFSGGTGLRSVLDTYVYLKNVSFDMVYVAAECEKLGVEDFERLNRSLALHLFGGESLTEAEQKMLDRVLSSGTFGKEENVAVNQIEEKGRGRYFLSKLTLPLPIMYEHYPVLKKALFLYPFCWLHRLVHGVIYKNKKVKQQVKAILSWKDKS